MSMDGRYSAKSHGRRCGYVHGWTDRYLLLGNSSCIALISYIHVTMQYLHFHHVVVVFRGAMRPTWMWEGRATQEQLPRWQGVTHVQGWTDRYLLLGNSSCIVLISYIHVTMQYLHFHHPRWSYVALPYYHMSCTYVSP